MSWSWVHLVLFTSLFLIHSALAAQNVGVLVVGDEVDKPVHTSFLSALLQRNFTPIQVLSSSSLQVRKGICSALTQGILAFFATAQSAFLQSLATLLDLPHCTPHTHWETPTPGFSTALTSAHWKELLRHLVAHLEPPAVALLFETREGLWKLQTLLEAPSPIQRVFVHKLDDPLGVLRQVRERVRTIIIDSSLERIKDILRMVVQLEMRDHHYILTNLDTHTIDLTEFSNVNLTAFRFVSSDMLTEEGLAMDCVEAFALGLASLPAEVRSENLSCDHLGLPWSQGLTLQNYISSVDFVGQSGRVSFREGERSSVELQILRQGLQGGFSCVGDWSSSHGLNLTHPFYDNTARNITLVVTAVLETPYVQLRANASGNAQFEGFSVDLLRLIANQVGFKYVLEYEGKYGVMDFESGEWNGVVRELMENKADLAIGSMTINYARESVIDFTKPFMHLGISILFKVPTRPEPKLFSFLNPLAVEIWLSVVFSYFCVSVTMYIVSRFSPEETEHFGIANAFWYPVGTLMQQGSDLNPRATSTRLVGGFWWFFSLVIVSSYTANLAAFLTVERMSTPIESAEDLAEQSEIAYGTLDSGSTMTFFRDSKMETFQKMWRFMESRKPSVFVSSYEEGIRRVLEGNYAFLMESSMLDYVVHQNCNLTQIGGLLDSKGYGIATPIGSVWRDKISLAILEMTEKGIIQSLKNKWWRSSAVGGGCHGDWKKKEHSQMEVNSIGGVFVVLLVGLSVAVFVAIVEFCVHAKQSSTSICSEMAREARFAVRCRGNRRRPALTRHCANCCDEREETTRRRVYHDYNTYPHEHHFNNGGI